MFDNAVIRPKHKETNKCFFVEEVVSEISPKNLLPNDKLRTFKSFYEIKHNQIITQDDQPLLRISIANKHHFMLVPVSTNAGNHEVNKSALTMVTRAYKICFCSA